MFIVPNYLTTNNKYFIISWPNYCSSVKGRVRTFALMDPDEDDKNKLVRVVKYLRGSRSLVLTLQAEDVGGEGVD